MQLCPVLVTPSSSIHSSIEHVELMATSSGTEVNMDVEEEVEYVEEIVEYEDEEVEEEEEEEIPLSQQQAPTAGLVSMSADATVKLETATAPATASSSIEKKERHEEEPTYHIPPSSSAQELHVTKAQTGASQTGDSVFQASSLDSQPTRAAAPPSGADGTSVDLDFKQLEAQAAKVAKEVSHLALDVSSKLTAGLRSAFGGAEGASAGASLTKLAGGLTSWWGSLDPAPQPVLDETAELVASANKASGELQQLFGLSAEENLVEHFKCKLLQTYACSHNAHTPAIQLAFQGTLYVTDRHTCYCVEERGRKAPFKVPHSQVVKATRQRPARKGDLSDVLKLEFSNGQWLAFKDFDSGSALDSALALVEHLMEGS